MSLRKIAKILGISPTYLSLLLNRKRPWRGNLKERYEELINANGGQSEIEEGRNLNSIPEMVVGRQGFEPWTLGLKVWVYESVAVHQRPVSLLLTLLRLNIDSVNPRSSLAQRQSMLLALSDIDGYPIWDKRDDPQ